MKSVLKKIKKTKIGFYITNLIFNYKFWILCKKKFIYIEYSKKNFFGDVVERIKKRRFVGYSYKDKTYLDNPGILNIDADTWISWKKKNLF